MKKNIIFTIFIILFIGIGIYLYFFNNSSDISNYRTSKLSTNNDISDTSNKEKNNTDTHSNNTTLTDKKKDSIETEIASFTTKIRTKYSERQNNISIACQTLNDTIVEKNSTFSFCKTLGKATTAKGYQEANVFQDGKEISALGGGKCQVSSTLYNAVLMVPELKVIERHPHSGKVYYVPQGKDAAVSYGSYDFKFKNNTSNKIRIKASNTENELTIKLLKIE